MLAGLDFTGKLVKFPPVSHPLTFSPPANSVGFVLIKRTGVVTETRIYPA